MRLTAISAYAAPGECTALITVDGLQQPRWLGCLDARTHRFTAATSACTARRSQSSLVISGDECCPHRTYMCAQDVVMYGQAWCARPVDTTVSNHASGGAGARVMAAQLAGSGTHQTKPSWTPTSHLTHHMMTKETWRSRLRTWTMNGWYTMSSCRTRTTSTLLQERVGQEDLLLKEILQALPCLV